MNRAPRPRWSRRALMYLLVGVQVAILGAIVAWQEVNRLLDSGPTVDLEISRAHARKDPFRGASVSGAPALDLGGADARLPPERLRPGERVLVFFAVEPGRRPRVSRVERRGWGAGPAFSPAGFSIPGRVQGKRWRRSFSPGGEGLVASVGRPPVAIELDLPGSIFIEEAALDRFPEPSLLRAGLHRGFFGHRYFDDVRIVGRGWTYGTSFAYDEGRDHLVVVAPKEERYYGRRLSGERQPRSEVFVFDGLGSEVGSAEVAGRLVEGVVNPADGSLWGLLSRDPWGVSMVHLVRLDERGQVVQQGQQIRYDRIIGFDGVEGGLWTLEGTQGSSNRPPYFVERLSFGGFRGPRLGAFASRPRTAVSSGRQVWVLEPDQHRVTRLDRRTGRIEQEYRDVNRPTDIAVDAGAITLIEANQTQLSRFSPDGQVRWRVPRFQGLAWILPQPGTGGGWVGATHFEGKSGGVFRYDSDGKIAPVSGDMKLWAANEWNRRRLGPEAFWAVRQGRIYVRQGPDIAVLRPDGTLLKRVEGFRYAKERPLRG